MKLTPVDLEPPPIRFLGVARIARGSAVRDVARVRHYQPNSLSRGSLMPKWWAISWITVR